MQAVAQVVSNTVLQLLRATLFTLGMNDWVGCGTKSVFDQRGFLPKCRWPPRDYSILV